MEKRIKILLVSDTTHFALTDVYYGYVHALEALKVPFKSYPFHHFKNILSRDICYQMIHSEALRKDLGFTHVMFIGGLNIPSFLLESLYDVKSVIIATEDPHTFDPMKDRLNIIDYYFSNEKSIGEYDGFENTFYCPTAADTYTCGTIPRANLDDKYLSDILFLGAMYPNREKMLLDALDTIKEKGWNLKIMGHPGYMAKESPLWEFVPPENYNEVGGIRTIPHEETIQYYNGAKITLNFFRDTKWNPRTDDLQNPFNKSEFEALSLNPRAYEVPLCGSLQLLEDTRKEARDTFTDQEVGFFSDGKDLARKLEYFLEGKGTTETSKMVAKAMMKVAENHTYIHRLRHILGIINGS